MNKPHDEALRRLEILRQDYQAGQGKRIGEIVSAWQAVIAASDPTLPRADSLASLSNLLRRVHATAGSAGVFGFGEISCAASALEEALDRQIASGPPSEADMLALDVLVKTLQVCASE